MELNSLFIGTCFFIVSVVSCFKLRLSPLRKGLSLQFNVEGNELNTAVTVLDLKFPCFQEEALQNLINDEVILKTIIGRFLYDRLKATSNSNLSMVLALQAEVVYIFMSSYMFPTIEMYNSWLYSTTYLNFTHAFGMKLYNVTK